MGFNELRNKEKLSIKDAKNKKFERAHEKLRTDFIEPLKALASPPSDYVRLDGKLASTNIMRVHML
jgi:hypothetical protein